MIGSLVKKPENCWYQLVFDALQPLSVEEAADGRWLPAACAESPVLDEDQRKQGHGKVH